MTYLFFTHNGWNRYDTVGTWDAILSRTGRQPGIVEGKARKEELMQEIV